MSAEQDWLAIAADKEYRQQPLSEQVKVANNFFDKRIKPNIPSEKKGQIPDIRKSFINEYFPPSAYAKAVGWEPMAKAPLRDKLHEVVDTGVPMMEGVKKAAQANAEIFSKVPRAMANLSMAHMNYAAQARMPGADTSEEVEKFYPDKASEISEHLARRGYPKLGQMMGV